MDSGYSKKVKMPKAARCAYAQEKQMEELLIPPSKPPPAWLSDPTLLPKKPPGRSAT